MAAITVVSTLWMTSGLTGSDIAVMAETALLGGFIVGKWRSYRSPHSSGMTSIAQVTGERMSR